MLNRTIIFLACFFGLLHASTMSSIAQQTDIPTAIDGKSERLDTLSIRGDRMVISTEHFIEKTFVSYSYHGDILKQYFLRPRNNSKKSPVTSFMVAGGYLGLSGSLDDAEKIDEYNNSRYEKKTVKKDGLFFGLRYDKIHNTTYMFTDSSFEEIPLIDSLINRVIWLDGYKLNDLIYDCLVTSISRSNNDTDIYVCKEGIPGDFPYSLFPEITFFSLDATPLNEKKTKKKLKDGVQALFVSYSLNGNLIHIVVSNREVKRISNQFVISKGEDIGDYLYQYSEERIRWGLIKTE